MWAWRCSAGTLYHRFPPPYSFKRAPEAFTWKELFPHCSAARHIINFRRLIVSDGPQRHPSEKNLFFHVMSCVYNNSGCCRKFGRKALNRAQGARRRLAWQIYRFQRGKGRTRASCHPRLLHYQLLERELSYHKARSRWRSAKQVAGLLYQYSNFSMPPRCSRSS